jgi:hypothetical protein
LMNVPRPALAPILTATLLVALLGACVAGCDADSATAGGGARREPVAPHEKAEAATPTRPKEVLRPGALTQALPAAGDRPYDKTFDDIRFDMDPAEPFVRSMLTPAIEALAGQRIRIRGYILPTPQKRGIKQFVLVRDNQQCCFGQGAALYDCILVEMKPGKSAEYLIRPVAVEGTFSIDELLGPDGRHLAIYRLEAESVE